MLKPCTIATWDLCIHFLQFVCVLGNWTHQCSVHIHFLFSIFSADVSVTVTWLLVCSNCVLKSSWSDTRWVILASIWFHLHETNLFYFQIAQVFACENIFSARKIVYFLKHSFLQCVSSSWRTKIYILYHHENLCTISWYLIDLL